MSEAFEIAPRLASGGYVAAFQAVASEIEGLIRVNHLDLTKPDVQYAPAAQLQNLNRGDRDTLGRHFASFRKDRIDGYRILNPNEVFGDRTGWGTVRSAIERLNATKRMLEFGSVASPVVYISQDFGAISVTLTFAPREPAI